jgi:hypothetical protein
MQELADSIPVLDETLPLSELRKNPDSMVVLASKTNTVKKPAQQYKEEKVPAVTSSPAADNEHADTLLGSDNDSQNGLDDQQIREILENDAAYISGSRSFAKYAFILSVLIIVTIGIYLVF